MAMPTVIRKVLGSIGLKKCIISIFLILEAIKMTKVYEQINAITFFNGTSKLRITPIISWEVKSNKK